MYHIQPSPIAVFGNGGGGGGGGAEQEGEEELLLAPNVPPVTFGRKLQDVNYAVKSISKLQCALKVEKRDDHEGKFVSSSSS
jgi:hypothetical protein